jgi:hypothetical protein
MLERLSKALPLITTGLIVFGMYNLHDYYNRYNISIYNYVDVSEILFSFAEILPVAMLFGMGILYNVVIENEGFTAGFAKRDMSPELTEAELEDSFNKTNKINRKRFRVIMPVVFCRLGGAVCGLYLFTFKIL